MIALFHGISGNWCESAPGSPNCRLRSGRLSGVTKSNYGFAYQAGFEATVRFLLSKRVPAEIAEETAQAAWSRGWERIDQLRDEELLRTWVNAIALNMYRRSARDESRNQPLLERSGGVGVDVAAIDLGRLLSACCSSDRALLLQHLHGWTTSEIAREAGASETAVRLRLMRARRAARSITKSRSIHEISGLN